MPSEDLLCVFYKPQGCFSQIFPASGIETKAVLLMLPLSGCGFTEVQDRQHLIIALRKTLATPLTCRICTADSDPVLITPVSHQQTS